MKPNPFTNLEIVTGYESWYKDNYRQVDQKEKALLRQLLTRFPEAHSILEVGCGTGHFTRWFSGLGLQAVGLDRSQPMLNEALKLNTLFYLQGDAQNLPFLSKSYDLVALITALEFLSDPIQGLTELVRVAREGIILGVLNADSWLGRKYQRKGGPIWGTAHLYTLDELKGIIKKVAGEKATINWRTTLWQVWPGALPLPWGGFIGMAVKLSNINK